MHAHIHAHTHPVNISDFRTIFTVRKKGFNFIKNPTKITGYIYICLLLGPFYILRVRACVCVGVCVYGDGKHNAVTFILGPNRRKRFYTFIYLILGPFINCLLHIQFKVIDG